MAKSARASRVKASRANLRKRVFNPVDDARAERLSEKLMQLAAQPKPEQEKSEGMDVDTSRLSKKGSKAAQANEETPIDTSMEIDEPSTTSNKSRTNPRPSRVQKKRRGKSHSTITFPAFRNGRKVPIKNSRSKKKK